MQFQLRQCLASGEFVILDDEIALLVVGPIAVLGLGERGYGDAEREGDCNSSTNEHGESSSNKGVRAPSAATQRPRITLGLSPIFLPEKRRDPWRDDGMRP